MRYGILLCVVIGFFLLLDVGQRIHMITVGYEIEQLLTMRRDLRRVNKELTIERETLTAPDRIEQIALHSLNMTFPAEGQIVYVGESAPPEEAPDPDSGTTLVRSWAHER